MSEHNLIIVSIRSTWVFPIQKMVIGLAIRTIIDSKHQFLDTQKGFLPHSQEMFCLCFYKKKISIISTVNFFFIKK